MSILRWFSDIKGSRSATYVVAASNAPAHVKAQADYVCDGTADEVEIQAGIDSLATTGEDQGGLVHLSARGFYISDTILVGGRPHSLSLVGEGPGTTRIWLTAGSNVDVISDADAESAIYRLVLAGFEINGNSADQDSGNGIVLSEAHDATLRDIFIRLVKDAAVKLDDSSESTTAYNVRTQFSNIGFDISRFCRLSHCNVIGPTTYGFYIHDTTYVIISDSAVDGDSVLQVTETGFRVSNASDIALIGNMVWYTNTYAYDIYADGEQIQTIKVIGNQANLNTGVGFRVRSTNSHVNGLIMIGNTSRNTTSHGFYLTNIIRYSRVADNMAYGDTFQVSPDYFERTIVENNYPYIAPGEIRSVSNSLTKTGSTITDGTGTVTGSPVTLKPGANTPTITVAGTFTVTLPTGCKGTAVTGDWVVTGSPVALVAGENTITVEAGGGPGTITINVTHVAFAVLNPEAHDGLVRKVVIDITTAGGTALATMKVGIADDAYGTNIDTSFFDAIDLNATGVLDSWVAGDAGQQTKWVAWEDNASATDGYIVGLVETEVAESLVGKYHVEYEGR